MFTTYKADPNKNSLLAWAVSRDYQEITKLLIEYKADINLSEVGDIAGQTPIFFAETQNLISLLVKNGANINQIDQRGFTPLMNAIQEDKPELVTPFIKNKAAVNFTNENKQTPLSLAKFLGNKKIINILQKSRCKVICFYLNLL